MFINSLGELLLEQQHDLLDILAGHKVHGDGQGLPPHVEIRAGKDSQNLHGKIVEDALIGASKLVDLLQNDELDVVVGLLDAQLDELGGGSLDSDRVAGQSGKR